VTCPSAEAICTAATVIFKVPSLKR
jgi:hypothetical protein